MQQGVKLKERKILPGHVKILWPNYGPVLSQTVYYAHYIPVFTVALHGKDYYLDLTE